jgi:hypothetical protein
MSKRTPKLPAPLQAALVECGLPWRASFGGKHIKIYVGERFMGVISHGKPDDIKGLNSNIISRIRNMKVQHGSPETYGHDEQHRA